MRRGPIFYLPSSNLACACVKPIAASCSLFGISNANVPEKIEKSSPPKWGANSDHLLLIMVRALLVVRHIIFRTLQNFKRLLQKQISIKNPALFFAYPLRLIPILDYIAM